MKKDITYIDAHKFELVIMSKEGLTVTPQKGFVKVSGAKGRNVYVPLTKEVGRVDLSGLEPPPEMEGIVNLGEKSFGSVTHQLDFSRPEEEILATFSQVLDHLLTLPAREIVRKGAKGRTSSATGWTLFAQA